MKPLILLTVSLGITAMAVFFITHEGHSVSGKTVFQNPDKRYYAVDAMSLATYNRWIDGKGVMSKEMIKKEIIKMIKGKKTYVLATSMNNIPLTTTIEYALDEKNMVLYGFSEKNTEKLFHIKKNPLVSLNWHEEFKNNFARSFCIQIRGYCEIVKPGSQDVKRAVDVYPYQYMPWGWLNTKNLTLGLLMKPLSKLIGSQIGNMAVITKIRIDQAVITNSTFEFKNYNNRQVWVRKGQAR